MNVKEAIEILKGYETPAALVVISALRYTQKREREMFKKLQDNCMHGRTIDGRIRQTCFNTLRKCTKRNCPLLKGSEG